MRDSAFWTFAPNFCFATSVLGVPLLRHFWVPPGAAGRELGRLFNNPLLAPAHFPLLPRSSAEKSTYPSLLTKFGRARAKQKERTMNTRKQKQSLRQGSKGAVPPHTSSVLFFACARVPRRRVSCSALCCLLGVLVLCLHQCWYVSCPVPVHTSF